MWQAMPAVRTPSVETLMIEFDGILSTQGSRVGMPWETVEHLVVAANYFEDAQRDD